MLIALLTGDIVQAAGSEAAQDKAARAWLGVIAGGAASSETMLAADMASLFPNSGQLRVRPMLGDAGAGNLAALLHDAQVDLAFVSTDALADEAAKEKDLADKLELVARLSPQEVHLLARADIGGVSELSGRQVNFGPAGSASAVTAAVLFKALGLKVEPLALDADDGARATEGRLDLRVGAGRRQAVASDQRHSRQCRHPSVADLVRHVS